eukprot:1165718-Heterocapsa_arctica.AAC.1
MTPPQGASYIPAVTATYRRLTSLTGASEKSASTSNNQHRNQTIRIDIEKSTTDHNNNVNGSLRS